MRNGLPWLPLLVGILTFSGTPAHADPSTPATNAASTNAPASAAPAAIELANVVAEADIATAHLHDLLTNLSSDTTVSTIDESLPKITREIDQRRDDDARLLSSSSSLATLRTARAGWQAVVKNLGLAQRSLVDRITLLDHQGKDLAQQKQKWLATLALAQSSAAPPDLLKRINGVLASIAQAATATQGSLTQTLSTQSRVAEQAARVQDALALMQKAEASAVELLFTQDSAPLWDPEVVAPHPSGVNAEDSPAAQTQALRLYLQDKMPTLVMHLLGFIFLTLTLYWIRHQIRAKAKNDPALREAAGIFDVPAATAALIALVASLWLYPLPPRLFLAVIGAAALIPTVVILRLVIERTLFPVLYGLVLSYAFNQLRYVASSAEIVSRSLFLFELVAGTLFLGWVIHSHRKRPAGSQPGPVERTVHAFAHVALFIFVVAGLANVLGYVHLSLLLGNATLSSGYLAVILYAAARVIDTLALSALKVPPLASFGMVQRHQERFAHNVYAFIHGVVALFWLWRTLDLFSLRGILWEKGSAILQTNIGWGSHVRTIGDIVAFGITVWAAFFISRVIRFFLHEEIFPHLQLPAGVPYTAATLVHYAVLTLGFFAALDFLGIRLSDFAILAGAFGVGLGFGLQNIMNNFVSGIILLFERPIKVGDIIQVDTAVGTVESIGIRASVIRLTNGSEVIVPNGNLISNPVTNWTFSNRQRMVEVPVVVVSKVDPAHVMDVLVKIALEHSLVLKEPTPVAFVTTFTAAALTLELRVWTNSPDAWVQIRSDLSVAITAALGKENIAIG